nr:hypothetical protein Itr_chr01CG01180 [Ipomoea trifida]
MEKLRETVRCRDGSEDPGFDTAKGLEYLLAGLEAKEPGGRGSSCSSLIFGEATSGGDALREMSMDEDSGWDLPAEPIGPLADNEGLLDNGLPDIGPEKESLFAPLTSNVLTEVNVDASTKIKKRMRGAEDPAKEKEKVLKFPITGDKVEL